MGSISRSQERIRLLAVHLNWTVTALVFVLELAILFVLKGSDQMDQPLPQYTFFYVILPSALNAGLCIGASHVRERFVESSGMQNAVPIAALTLICTVVAVIHCFFPQTLLLFLLPIFTSTVYGNRYLLDSVAAMSLFGVMAVVVRRLLDPYSRKYNDFLAEETVIALLIILAALYLARKMLEMTRMVMEGEIEGQQREKAARVGFQLVTTLANTIEAKDPYTEGHSGRVAFYAREIARRAGKEPEYLASIYYMALLHDIGKIGIPDSILKKRGPLTEEEYAIIKTHPSVGAEILSDITEMPRMQAAARYHHERWDGKGYPEGLSGTEIPEEARIIAVADAYDAMTSRRSYRPALSQRTAREEIERGMGSQFDPHFAEIMLAMIDEDKGFVMHGSSNEDQFGLMQVRALLNEGPGESGAYLVSQAGFSNIYHFLRRYARRKHAGMQLCLISVSREKPSGMMMLALWDKNHEEEEQAMEKLREIIGASIRQTDIVSRADISQFMLILTDAETENIETVAGRIREKWEKTRFSQTHRVDFEAQDLLDDGRQEKVRIS